MARLKKIFIYKIKASSLTEVIVSTSILLIVFAIALLTLNNIMMSTMQKDTQALDTEIEKLIYQYRNKQVTVPVSYQEEENTMNIQRVTIGEMDWIEFSIKDEKRNKTRTKRIITTLYEN